MSNLEDRQRAATPIAVYAPFGSFAPPIVKPFREGQTLYEIMLGMDLPADFKERGVIQINGNEILRGAWHLVRPKPSVQTRPISVTFHLAPRGGKKKGGGKAILAIVAALALMVVTAGISGGALAGLGGTSLFAAGSISAKILAGAVGLIGALAIAALTRPPAQESRDDRVDNKSAASAEGNQLDPNGPVARVIGTRKIFPPLAAEPYVELIGHNEYVYAVYVLNGPHDLASIKIGDSSIEDDDAVTYQVREGWPSDTLQTLVPFVARTSSNNVEIKGHRLAQNSNFNLERQDTPERSCPQWHRLATRDSPDKVAIHLLFPGGIIYGPTPTTIFCVPIRIRFRREGDANWTNMPEIHYFGSSRANQIRAQVVFYWDSDRAPSGAPETRYAGWWYANTAVPAQTANNPADPGTYQWQADSYFYAGSGATYTAVASGPVSGIRNISFDLNDVDGLEGSSAMGEYTFATGTAVSLNCCNVWLDSDTFPKGIYEVEMMRGSAYTYTNFSESAYQWNGAAVRNFFRYYNAGGSFANKRLFVSQEGVTDSLAVARVVSFWNESPLPYNGFATIAIRGKNKQVQNVSCIASGYVQDWDGTGWNAWTTTSNPAPHLRDIWTGRLNLDPLPVDLLDDGRLVEWRRHCEENDYTCDFISEGQRIEEALSIVASCGYARPYWSDLWSVIIDCDRSYEGPVQTFTGHNARGFKFRKGLARLPDGLRVTYRADNVDYSQRQVSVYRNGVARFDDTRIEQVTYEGLVSEAKIEQRARFDLRQGEYRSTFYSFEAPFEWIVCRRGSLIAVQNDILTHHSASARIKSVNVSGGDVVSIVLNTEVEILNDKDMLTVTDMLAETDILSVMKMGAMIRRTDGTISTHALSNASGTTNTLTFETPFPAESWTGGFYDSGSVQEVAPGCIVAVGPIGEEYLRLVVSEITPGKDGTAQVTCVDEAPELWAA